VYAEVFSAAARSRQRRTSQTVVASTRTQGAIRRLARDNDELAAVDTVPASLVLILQHDDFPSQTWLSAQSAAFTIGRRAAA